MSGPVESSNCDERKRGLERICAVSIAVASPEEIRSWSSGEVTLPVAFNARVPTSGGSITSKQLAKGGLLCERIFGPISSYRCACGKYRGGKRAQASEGTVCEHCGVLVADRKVRCQRMGHIELAAPVVHPFFFQGLPSVLAELFSVAVTARERFEPVEEGGNGEYVSLDMPKEATLNEVKLTPQLVHQIIFHERSFVIEDPQQTQQGEELTGAEGIKALLERLEPYDLKSLLEQALMNAKSNRKKETLAALLQFVSSEGSNRLESLVLEVLPVVPAISRDPTVLKVGDETGQSRMEVGDLNRLYGRVIRTNNSLRQLLEEAGSKELIRHRKRSLQRAVVALFENESLKNPVRTESGRPLGSLLGLLKGKTGRFRGSLLAKRVDFSGRAVIVVNPKLRINQCGLPKKIALELYRPFVLRELRKSECRLPKKLASELLFKPFATRKSRISGVDNVDRLFAENAELVLKHLQTVMADHPVLLNRAPTLHRMNVQAFFPVLAGGNAIELHPLVCRAFNADFDGDQMAVHLPLGIDAKVEAKTMLSCRENLLSPADGSILFRPTQDIVLGLYYLTMAGADTATPQKAFASFAEVELAREIGKTCVHEPIAFRMRADREVMPQDSGRETRGSGGRITTTIGRALFNRLLPEGLPYYNMPLSAKHLHTILTDCFERLGANETLRLTEEIALMGAAEATRSGLSLGVSDLLIPKEKDSIVTNASERAKRLYESHKQGTLSFSAWKAQHVETWNRATEQVAAALLHDLRQEMRPAGCVNPVLVMAESGARGSIAQLKQLSGMRGLMARATGEVAERPITASLREGLTNGEFFVSAHGAHKSFIDVGLKTAEGGYLTRRLVHAASPVVVTMYDCGTAKGIFKHATAFQSLSEAVAGRTNLEAVRRGGNGWLGKNQLVTRAICRELDKSSRKRLRVRSPLTCEAPRGVCAKCYGMDRSTGRLVEVGTAVGVIAAQSIGEPGTQLTMQTKHTGGIAGVDMTGGLRRVEQLFEARCPVLRRLFAKKGPQGVWQHLLAELIAPYRAQGVSIDEKHFEVIIAQMLGQARVIDGGDSRLIPGTLIKRRELAMVNAALPPGAKQARAKAELLGVTRAALASESFLAAASFREPKQVLREAALCSRRDTFSGITENVLIGGLIPAGSGFDEDAEVLAEVITKVAPKRAKPSNEHSQQSVNTAPKKVCITISDPQTANAMNIVDLDRELETLVTGLNGAPEDKQKWDRVIELAWDRLFEGISGKQSSIDDHVARRLTSKVFEEVMRSGKRFHSAKAFWAFVWRQRKWQRDNYLAREGARRKRERSLLQKLIEREESEQEREAEAETARRVLHKIVAEAQLTDYQRAVFELAWIGGLADSVIAQELKKSHGAIRRTKTHIKGKLRDTPTARELRES